MMAHPSLLSISLTLGLLALAFPWLQTRGRMISILVNNAPAKLMEVNVFTDSSIKFTDRVRNCEDALVVEEDGLAILSCDPGRDLWNTVMGVFTQDRTRIPNGELFVYRYGSRDGGKAALAPIKILGYPGEFSLHPLGIEYDRASSTLFVCNHHLDGSRVDVFSLDLGAGQPTAKHTRTVMSPLLKGPNAILAFNEHELYVTNDHYILRKDQPWLTYIETYGGIPGGSISYVNLTKEEAQVRTVARVPFANGVTLLNDSMVAVASSSTGKVILYDILADRSLTPAGAIIVPFAPDNLSTDKNGVLLIAGHPHPPSLDAVVHRRLACIERTGLDITISGDEHNCLKADSPSQAMSWTSEGGLKDLFLSRGEYGSGCTAVYDATRNVGLITGLYEKGILVWKR